MAILANSLLMRACSLGLGLMLLGSAGLGLVGCKKDATAEVDQDAVANVKVGTSATLGPYLTDASGNTLYIFARDVDGTNACTSATCNPLWPVYYEANIKVPKSLKAEDFATKATTDGRMQTTYKGWPLYYYAPAANGVYTREASGVTSGNGVGTVWHVVNPGYGVVLASKTVEDKTTRVSSSKTFLVDMQGRTMYYFAKDNTNPTTLPTNCTGGCAAIWPAVYMSAPMVPSTLRASDFATITRAANAAGAREQLTYKGRPLYYYAGDAATRGRAEGHNLNDSGDLWFVAAP
jgi:predicted lipoprotein with Yx(FWY)xxD motif